MRDSGNQFSVAIGARLRAYRESIGLTQDQFAARCGGTKRGIQENESGKSAPNSKLLAALARMGLNLSWLLNEVGPMLMEDVGAGAHGPASAIDAELLQLVLEKVEKEIAAAGVKVDPKKKADFVVLLYEYIEETGSRDSPNIDRILRLVA